MTSSRRCVLFLLFKCVCVCVCGGGVGVWGGVGGGVGGGGMGGGVGVGGGWGGVGGGGGGWGGGGGGVGGGGGGGGLWLWGGSNLTRSWLGNVHKLPAHSIIDNIPTMSSIFTSALRIVTRNDLVGVLNEYGRKCMVSAYDAKLCGKNLLTRTNRKKSPQLLKFPPTVILIKNYWYNKVP